MWIQNEWISGYTGQVVIWINNVRIKNKMKDQVVMKKDQNIRTI